MTAGRRGCYGDRERSRPSEDLWSRVRSRDAEEREATNGCRRYTVSSSGGGSANNHKRSHLPVKSNGEEDSRVRSSDGGGLKKERKRKISPIVWDRDDNNTCSQSSGRSMNCLDDHGFVLRSSIDAMVLEGSPDDREAGEIEGAEDEDDFSSVRQISLSRWAGDDEGGELDEQVLPEKGKKSPLMENKPPSPELGEIVTREGSEGAISKSSGLGRESKDGSYQENEVDRNNYMDVDADGLNRENTPELAIQPRRTINMLQACRRVDEFERLGKINEGTYGVVYRARDERTGEVVALKKVKMEKQTEGFPLTALREINLLLSLDHPCIVDVKEVVVGSTLDTIFMVMEYMEHDLTRLMETMMQPFSQDVVKGLMWQLLSGVNYLHDNWVLHRDLKTSNLLRNDRGHQNFY